MKKLKPCEATSHRKICTLDRDNINTPKSWAMVSDGKTLTLVNQRNGEDSTGKVILSFSEFRKISDWFFGKKSSVKPKRKV